MIEILILLRELKEKKACDFDLDDLEGFISFFKIEQDIHALNRVIDLLYKNNAPYCLTDFKN